MEYFIHKLETLFSSFPLSFMEVWGRFGFIVGLVLMIGAYSGIIFRPNRVWRLGRMRQRWDPKALISVIVTFVLVIATGYAGSYFVMVEGAQTFESFKDLSVFVCILLFGYPALVIIPIAYGISDLIEGVPPTFIWHWALGYLINPACFWMAYLFIGKNPDFRRLSTWSWYLLFVLLFLSIEPAMWGFICSMDFSSAVSYRKITPAIFFTTSLTWILAPIAMLCTLPLAKKIGFFWAEVPNHVEERVIGSKKWIWTSGKEDSTECAPPSAHTFPIRMINALAFAVMTLVIVGTTAFVLLRSDEHDSRELVSRLHERISNDISTSLISALKDPKIHLEKVLTQLADANQVFIFIFTPSQELIGSAGQLSATQPGAFDPHYRQSIVRDLTRISGRLKNLTAPVQFEFETITASPLSIDHWLIHATPLATNITGHGDWILVTVTSEAFYFESIRSGSSQSAMVFAVFLTVSLILSMILAGFVANPICQLASAIQAMTRGELDQQVPSSHLEEVSLLADSFNAMAKQLSHAYSDLRTAKEAAESANRMKTEFLDSAAHELRTPLTSITLLVELAQEKQEQDGNFIIPASHFNQIVQGITILTRLSDDLLNVARLKHGGLSLHLINENILSTITECVQNTRESAPLREIHYHPIYEPVFTCFDPVQISQVMMNLLDNGLKYSPENTPLEVRITVTDQHVEVSVIDHGSGLSKQHQLKLFTKFYRPSTDATLRQPGLGLGLYVCKQIMDLHGGTIGMEGELGHGSRFFFRLPRKECP